MPSSPRPAPIASLSPVPLAIMEGNTRNFTVNGTSVGTGVRVVVNQQGESGNLSLNSTCPGGTQANVDKSTTWSVSLKACSDGIATVRLYKAGTNILLRIYEVTVTPSTDVTFHHLASWLVDGQKDDFFIAASGMTPRVGHTITLTTSNRDIGFDSSCASTAERTTFTPSTSGHSVEIDLYACDMSGGTVTAQLRRGRPSGTILATKTFSVRVTLKPTASLSPVPTTIVKDQSKRFRVYNNVPVSGILVAVNDTGDTGNLSLTSSCPSFIGVGQEYITGSYLNFKGCEVGTAKIGLYKGETLVKSYTVTVTATAPAPTPTPTAGGPTVPTGGPSVNAGLDQTVRTGKRVSLTGTGSPVDPDDDASYSWTQVSGTTVTLSPSANSANFTAPSTTGTLVFRLTVTDHGTGLSSWDEMTVTVAANRAPTANASSNRATVATGERWVYLNGSGTDPDGDTLSYGWSQRSGTTVTLRDASSATASFAAPSTPGALTFRLTVSDGSLSATDDVTITVTQ